MRIKPAPIIATIGISLFSIGAQAESLIDGDVDAGKAKAITCTACHGAEGNSVNPSWPNLAGQNATYLVAQLNAFKNGDRSNPLMNAQAMMLSEEDMIDLSVYFESLPAAAQPVADVNLVGRGEALYRGGNSDSGTAACSACHGPSGDGNPAAAYPALAGQHATYTAQQLRDYASGARKSDGKTMQMRNIATTLDEKDIEALAAYVQGLK